MGRVQVRPGLNPCHTHDQTLITAPNGVTGVAIAAGPLLLAPLSTAAWPNVPRLKIELRISETDRMSLAVMVAVPLVAAVVVAVLAKASSE
jgi:hypothetical protein